MADDKEPEEYREGSDEEESVVDNEGEALSQAEYEALSSDERAVVDKQEAEADVDKEAAKMEGTESDETPVVEPAALPEGEPTTGEWFQPSDEVPEYPSTEMSEDPKENIITAVVLVQYRNGIVVPLTSLDMKMHHNASPHEVFRMCADVADQISTMRVLGEFAQFQQKLTESQTNDIVRAVATMLARGPSK